MTREEARERLRGILTEAVEFENSVCYVTEEDREPLEMAIKALEQEPCKDAINRQAVKEQMLKYGFHAPDMTVTEFVEDLPPVHSQPNKEDIHREREQAYMRGFEDGSRKYRTEQSEDTINRKSAIEAFQMFREYESNRNNKEWVDRIETVLNQLPPVNPQPICEEREKGECPYYAG